MIFRQLLCVPDCEFVPHGLLRDLVFRQGLNDLIVDQQSADIEDFLTCRISRFKLDDTSILTILHACEYRGLNQFCLIL